MSTTLDLPQLIGAISDHAAIRRINRLQPVGGEGDKIFPPTYPGGQLNSPPRHVLERRNVNGNETWCVLLDSVQSQANRLEEALLDAAEAKGLKLPYVTVDFSEAGLDPLVRITSLDAPHRVYDAILRDSLRGDKPFMKSEVGRRLAAAKPADATALLELSPNALLFGAWHSQGEGGGLGAKFPRAIVSEIMGVDVPVDKDDSNQRSAIAEPRAAGRRTGSRIDPLGVQRNVRIYRSSNDDQDWTPQEDDAAKGQSGPILFSRKGGDKAGRPSNINHGNVMPTVEPLGVTCAYAEQRVVITLAGLRRLRFGNDSRSVAGRALIAALGLVALAEQDTRGYSLRSRCDLVCSGMSPTELVRADGSVENIELDRDSAWKLYHEAYGRAESVGFRFESITLKPQDKLVDIVRRSRELALQGAGGEGDDDS